MILCCLLTLPLVVQAQDDYSEKDAPILKDYSLQILNGDAASRSLSEFSTKKGKRAARSFNRLVAQQHSFKDIMRLWRKNGEDIGARESFAAKIEELGSNISPLEGGDSFYVDYMWYLILHHRNKNHLPKSDSLNAILHQYANSLPEDQFVRIKAEVFAQIHDNVMLLIKGNIKDGLPQSQAAHALAKSTNDTNLTIAAAYFLAEFYVSTSNLDGFLQLVEENYQLDSSRSAKSSFYYGTIFQWLDALIYSGRDFNRVESLINELEQRDEMLPRSLEYRLTYLGKLDPESEPFRRQLHQFNCQNLSELVVALDSIASNNLIPNVYTKFLISAAQALHRHQLHREAFSYMKKAIKNGEKVYSSQLSSDLAAVEANRVKREKDLEIQAEKEKNQLYVTLAIISSLLLILGVFTIVLLVRQSKKLVHKNSEIEQQRQQLELADNEKALLIKEIHHRVKNNFQVVSSLLELQSKGIEDEKAKELAEEGKNRVKSMALIHQRLYQNEDLLIRFDEYTKALIDEISVMFDMEIEADVKAKNMSFDIDTAIPLGLILNELITNAFKYGLDEQHRQLHVHFEKLDEHYTLIVKDNGKGMDPSFNIAKAKSLGLRLVRRLSQQLKGKVEILKEEGAGFVIYFKDTAMRKEMN